MDVGSKAWALLLSNITAYEFTTPEDQLLSRAFGRFRRKHPILALTATIVTVMHLWELFDKLDIPTLDPYQIGLLRWARRLEDIAA